jgi:hypothetical protein
MRRNCLLKHVIERNKESANDRSYGKTRKKTSVDDVKETRGYWNLKEEAVDRTVWRTRFMGSYGPAVRQTTE